MWFREIDKSNKNFKFFRFSKLKYLETERRVNLVKTCLFVLPIFKSGIWSWFLSFSLMKDHKNYKNGHFIKMSKMLKTEADFSTEIVLNHQLV